MSVGGALLSIRDGFRKVTPLQVTEDLRNDQDDDPSTPALFRVGLGLSWGGKTLKVGVPLEQNERAKGGTVRSYSSTMWRDRKMGRYSLS